MSEVVLVVDVKAAPGRGDAVVAAFEKASIETHKEDGCIAYALHRDNADPEHFVHIERWTTQAELDTHMTLPHTAELFAFAGTPGNLAAAPVLTFTTGLGLADPVKGRL